MNNYTKPVKILTDISWEYIWSPYDQGTYNDVLKMVHESDIVLEIGAGDLRLARQVAQIARKVIAIEIQPELIVQAQQTELPKNLRFIIGDARYLPFPDDITLAILLMRHCTVFPLYVRKLRQVGCNRLITNSRWRMGVELVDLDAPRMQFKDFEMGWYACECGSTGFKNGCVDHINLEVMNKVHEVRSCPECSSIDWF